MRFDSLSEGSEKQPLLVSSFANMQQYHSHLRELAVEIGCWQSEVGPGRELIAEGSTG
jgi:hypothetical protein